MKLLMISALLFGLSTVASVAQSELEFSPQLIPFDQLEPYHPPEPPATTVPRDQVTVGPPQTFTCTQAISQLQYILGQPGSVAYQVTYSPLRIWQPGDRYTSNYVATRLNIEISDQQVVTRLWCG